MQPLTLSIHERLQSHRHIRVKLLHELLFRLLVLVAIGEAIVAS